MWVHICVLNMCAQNTRKAKTPQVIRPEHSPDTCACITPSAGCAVVIAMSASGHFSERRTDSAPMRTALLLHRSAAEARPQTPQTHTTHVSARDGHDKSTAGNSTNSSRALVLCRIFHNHHL
uniref:Uncharacterized protein n=1 Tax=Knipowitschia caucasica TaxID=637954 RepID=A0AAV2J8W7_KNICA